MASGTGSRESSCRAVGPRMVASRAWRASKSGPENSGRTKAVVATREANESGEGVLKHKRDDHFRRAFPKRHIMNAPVNLER